MQYARAALEGARWRVHKRRRREAAASLARRHHRPFHRLREVRLPGEAAAARVGQEEEEELPWHRLGADAALALHVCAALEDYLITRCAATHW